MNPASRAASAHARRETYVDAWLPEPVDTRNDPALSAERGEALTLAVLVLFEKLSPTERAAYILHEAFDYSYREIADILQIQEANTRQLVSRARKHIADGRHKPINARQQRHLLETFIAATRDGDLAGLEGLFAEAVVSSSFWSQPHSPQCKISAGQSRSSSLMGLPVREYQTEAGVGSCRCELCEARSCSW